MKRKAIYGVDTVKDLDTKKGIVKFAYSKVGNYDSDKDRMLPNAFTRTINSFNESKDKGRIKHFKWHDEKFTPGKIKEMGMQGDFAYVVSQLSKNTVGRDTLIEYEEGIITEHSHGFDPIDGKYTKNEKGGYDFAEVKVWEVSTLTGWGANPETGVFEVKDLKTPEQVVAAMERVNKYLKVGRFSDELLQRMEIEIKQLNDLFKSLIDPPEKALDYPTFEEMVRTVFNT